MFFFCTYSLIHFCLASSFSSSFFAFNYRRFNSYRVNEEGMAGNEEEKFLFYFCLFSHQLCVLCAPSWKIWIVETLWGILLEAEWRVTLVILGIFLGYAIEIEPFCGEFFIEIGNIVLKCLIYVNKWCCFGNFVAWNGLKMIFWSIIWKFW